MLIACTFPIDQINEMKAAGHPFFAGLGEARIIPLPTGHWPMLSDPKGLAAALQESMTIRGTGGSEEPCDAARLRAAQGRTQPPG